MDGITGLLFGRDGGRLLNMILGPSREERDAADRTRRSGQWCGSTPGDAPPPVPFGQRRGPRPVPRGIRIRDFH
jgi:hypothetical protein